MGAEYPTFADVSRASALLFLADSSSAPPPALSSDEFSCYSGSSSSSYSGASARSYVSDSARRGRPVDPLRVLFVVASLRRINPKAKKLFPNTYLLVGCCNDELTNRYKGKTVMTQEERQESLRHCKWVDEVIPDAPWVLTQEFIDKHRIDYVAHDALPYGDTSRAANDVYEFVKKIGKFKETKRTDGVSTLDLVMRILKDYNQYVMRNLAWGYSRKDLGVSYVKEKQLQVNMKINKLRETVKVHQEKLQTVAKTAGLNLEEWLANADRWVAGFLEKFEQHCHNMVLAEATSTLFHSGAEKKRKGVWIEIDSYDDEDQSERSSALASEGSTVTAAASAGSMATSGRCPMI